MSHKSRRRVTIAAGAVLAGAAIPIAAAGIAWADTTGFIETYDGKVLFDTFPGGPTFGQSDVGTPALSGVNNDTATFIGPTGDYNTAAALAATASGGANDSFANDIGDQATDYDTGSGTGYANGIGAAIVGNGNGPVSYSSAYSSAGGEGLIYNNGADNVQFDHVSGSGPGSTGELLDFNNPGSGTTVVSGDGAYASNGSTAEIYEFGSGNMQNDTATAYSQGAFGDIANFSANPVSADNASAFAGTVIIGGDASNPATGTIFDTGLSFIPTGDVVIIDKAFDFVTAPSLF
jgi:hypothetical protein